MKKVEAVIQAFKADEEREALANEKMARITIVEVKGAGSDQGTPKHYRGTRYIQDSTDVKIEIVADNDDAERIANLIRDTLRTGELGDGEVVLVPIEQIFHLRVGRQGHRVSDWRADSTAAGFCAARPVCELIEPTEAKIP